MGGIEAIAAEERAAPGIAARIGIILLQDELALILGRSVDVVEEKSLKNPFRRREILRTRQILYAALDLPAGKILEILEPAMSRAPTPELKDTLAKIIQELHRGETRPEALRRLLYPEDPD